MEIHYSIIDMVLHTSEQQTIWCYYNKEVTKYSVSGFVAQCYTLKQHRANDKNIYHSYCSFVFIVSQIILFTSMFLSFLCMVHNVNATRTENDFDQPQQNKEAFP